MGGLAGYYEYSYIFWADDSIKNCWTFSRREGKKTYLFEIRTSFKLRGNDGQVTELGWERFGCGTLEDDVDRLEMSSIFRLLDDYSMSDDELRSWALAALDFAKQTQLAAADDSNQDSVIAVVVGLDVVTVQQEGEPVEAAKERAIKTESLIPLSLWDENIGIGKSHSVFFAVLPRKRVEEDTELTCVVCMRRNSFAKGTQISFLPTCNHAVHPRCLFEWLRGRNSSCPSCRVPIPSDDQVDRLGSIRPQH